MFLLTSISILSIFYLQDNNSIQERINKLIPEKNLYGAK
jgi:hypothetical protein